ncbi:hypothetical protein ACLMJK_002052 [Lecanora helva]
MATDNPRTGSACEKMESFDSCGTSTSVSTADSPSRLRSSTSLSSMDEDMAEDSPLDPVNKNSEKVDTTKEVDLVDALNTALAAKNKDLDMVDGLGNDFQIPDFTIKQIRDAIPAHCYERSGIRGLSYVARDISVLATVFLLFNRFLTPENVPSTCIRGALWAVYTFVQGLFATGVWVLAHECGHQSFSPSKTLNDTVGFICHSALLVPYFSWKISHGKHHKATGHMERDMVFVPKTREQYASNIGRLAHELSELMEETPIMTAGTLIGQQLLGWLMYINFNVTGHDFHFRQKEGRGIGKKNGYFGRVNHFDPASPLYEAKDAKLILASDVGLAVVFGILFCLGQRFGWANLAVWYFVPYLWVNHWLGGYISNRNSETQLIFTAVAITYLQHTDPQLPHYEDNVWNFTRGAAATVDRELGFIGRQIMHGIVETHVLHHFVSTIPFYHADEASEAIKPVMGIHYRSDTKDGFAGFLKALYRNSRMCQWVEPAAEAKGDGQSVLFFRNRNHTGVPPMKMAPVMGS